jgi:hypothetical protein
MTPEREAEIDGAKLISPNAFDGQGSVPDKVTEAAKRIATLRVKFVNQWMPGMDSPLTAREVDDLFGAVAIRAEWERELYEARDKARADAERLAVVLAYTEGDTELEENAPNWRADRDRALAAHRALIGGDQ